jgi:hypothetical protein
MRYLVRESSNGESSNDCRQNAVGRYRHLRDENRASLDPKFQGWTKNGF